MAAEQLTGYAARATTGVARADTAARRTAWERSMAEDMMVVVNKRGREMASREGLVVGGGGGRLGLAL